MAKVHIGESGRNCAEEYRRKAEDCRANAERDSGDRKSMWLGLAERWSAAADQVEVSLAAVKDKRDKNLFEVGTAHRQEPPRQDIAIAQLNGSSPPGKAPSMRRRRSGMVACGLSALALGLVGGVSLHRSVDRDRSAAGLQQTGSGTSRPVLVEQKRDAAASKPTREGRLEGLEGIEHQSNPEVASPSVEPGVQDAEGNTKPAAQLPTSSSTQLISKPGPQLGPSANNEASVNPTSKDLRPSTDVNGLADWSASGRI